MIKKCLRFHAQWCGPCRALEKVLENFDKCPIEHIDVDENEALSNQYNIRNIPALIFVDENNKEVFRNVGMITLDKLNKLYDENN